MSDWIDEVAWRSLVARHGESRDFDAWLDDLDAIYQVPDDPERYLMALCAGMSVESVDALVDSLQGVADRKRGQSGGPAGDTRDLVDPTGGEASTIGSPPSSSRPGSTTDTSTISQSENPVFSRRLSTTRSPVDL